MRFNYEGFDATSAVKRGWIEAVSAEDASGKLREMKIFAQSITPDGVKAQNIFPDEKATRVNFPDIVPQPEDPPDGFIRVFEPTKAGTKETPTYAEGPAKPFSPFAKNSAQQEKPHHADPPATPAPTPSFIPAPPEPAGSGHVYRWEEDLRKDLRDALDIALSITSLPNDGAAKWGDSMIQDMANWAAKTLVEEAARRAADQMRRDR